MIKIEGNKAILYQWDLNQRLILTEINFIAAGIEVHFSHSSNSTDDCVPSPVYIRDGVAYADIPNRLLQQKGVIYVYLYVQSDDKSGTEYRTEILVAARKKPTNYVDGMGDYEVYEGSYEVVPSTEMQVLETARKVMKNDLKVVAIPYYVTSNTAGGETVYIASELE